MKKILHIIPSLRLGGEEKFLLDIYPYLSKGFEHVVCPFIHAGELYTDTVNLEKSKNSRFWIFIFKSNNVFAKILKPFLFFYYAYRMRHFLKNENPDIIITYAYGPMSAFLLCFLALLSMRKKKFKWCTRFGSHANPGYFSAIFRGRVFYKFISFFLDLGLKSLINRTDCLFVVNQTLITELAAVNSDGIKKSFFLPICASDPLAFPNVFEESSLSRHLKKQTFFLAAGRLGYIKGFDFLIKTFAVFSKIYPDVKLVIIGNGPQDCFLKKLIRSLKLEEKVLLPGFLENPTLIGSDAIACIVPSRSEGFGKIIIEAMQASMIVVASNCAGPQEIIADRFDGMLFEKENSEALLQAMNEVMQMSEESKIIIKKNAHQKSLRYTPQKVSALLNVKLEMDCAS